MSLSRENEDLADYIRDQVCCPRIHGCELGGADECPAERVRSALNAARSVPLSVGVEEVARELYLSFWQRNGQAVEPFDATAPAIQAMWRHIADDAQSILSKLGREEDSPSRADLSPASRSHTPLSDGEG